MPLKITNTSPRVRAYEPEANEEAMRLALNLIDEIRDEANSKIIKYQKKVVSS